MPSQSGHTDEMTQEELILHAQALAAVDDAIMITDKDAAIVWVNPAFTRLTGYSLDEVRGQNPRILNSGRHNKDFFRNMHRIIYGKQVFRGEMIDKRKDGSCFTMETAISPILNPNGEITHFVSVKRDISARKESEEARQQALQDRSHFISMASHEVRTPLTAIKEALRLVLSGYVGPLNDDQNELLDIAQRNVERLARLINALLDFQKLRATHIEFDMGLHDINALAEEIAATMAPVAREKGLELITDLDDTVPRITFDKDRIAQVFTNVVNNAIKFTEAGRIVIRTQWHDNLVQVSISDTGPGIPPSDLPKIFQKFQQLASTKAGGTGLGLAICRQIIKRHQGKIWAESQFGKGTTIHFALPVVERRRKPRDQ
ncbi:MAG TPA: PAS domain-containing sensor histidine kinase [Anaerohalosphaeraceae bacterium]|jgi:PAS domain S-box-containing protein|nr:PAS domain-containing sensor histidine kinase [Anaerohalosphaeraceae bacterium]HRT49757.1 PAS domain-containing sensor histidine kinase [Anaerohalosphaeraceae bacterium]HRT85583.1 PAS domain-containing sensor histidine kinase [Anaerohalosphaeraceae bacterium]